MSKNKEIPPKAIKGSVLEVLRPTEQTDLPDYTDKEKVYISNLQKRLENARNNRDQSHEEFDDMTYNQYHTSNERSANTHITPSRNKGVRSFQTGTLRTKLLAFLSTLQGLNLRPDISAYRENNIPINTLGDAMTIVIEKTEEMEGDEEQRMLRQYELLKQGSVFVEDLWEDRWVTTKTLVKGELGDNDRVSWKAIKEQSSGAPKRKLLSPLSVYLGDLRQYFIKDQPFIYAVELLTYDDAAQLYETWDMWKHVSKNKRSFSGLAEQSMVNNAWRLLSEVQGEYVEKIVYQDKLNNEIQIILNGVLMMPIGFPLTEVSKDGEYTISQQNLEPIRQDFSYGKSFPFKHKNTVAVLDEMMKLAVLKTQKSFIPPYLNLSDRVLSRSIFMPGVITRGVEPGEIVPVSDKESSGVTNSEFGMINLMTDTIDKNTVSPTFTGSKEQGQTTATEILQLQRQARIMMGLLVLSASLLEKKLAKRRLIILLDKWFDPIDQTVDTVRDVLRNTYRIVSKEKAIEGKGMGTQMVIPTEESFASEDVMAIEDNLETNTGRPVRLLLLNPNELKTLDLIWRININPKEKKSSELSKLLFRAEIQDAMALGLRLNLDHVEDKFAEVWEEDRSKMFTSVLPPTQPGIETEQASETPTLSAQVKAPGSVESPTAV